LHYVTSKSKVFLVVLGIYNKSNFVVFLKYVFEKAVDNAVEILRGPEVDFVYVHTRGVGVGNFVHDSATARLVAFAYRQIVFVVAENIQFVLFRKFRFEPLRPLPQTLTCERQRKQNGVERDQNATVINSYLVKQICVKQLRHVAYLEFQNDQAHNVRYSGQNRLEKVDARIPISQEKQRDGDKKNCRAFALFETADKGYPFRAFAFDDVGNYVDDGKRKQCKTNCRYRIYCNGHKATSAIK